MRWQWFAVAAAFGLAAPAAAQFGYDGDSFVRAVREKNGAKAMELLKTRASAVINARDSKGDTGLIVAIGRRDEIWTSFLLKEGADPNLGARNGDTPIIVAARAGYQEAAEWLLSMRAKVDSANRAGETALIVAVQNRHAGLVKVLLSVGADPDRADSAAGYSARDYARRDSRSPELLRAIEAARPAKAKAKL